MEETHPRQLPAPSEVREEINVLARTSPLRQGRIAVTVPQGHTVSELVRMAEINPLAPYDVQARVNGELIARDRWPSVQPCRGDLVVIDVVPMGGKVGKGILSIVFGIGLALVGFFPALSAFGALGALGSVPAGALVAAGALSIGSGIYSLAAPAPATPFDGDIPTSSESPALLGRGNTVRPFEPIARQFGQWRRFPSYAAKPYTETVGSDQFLRLLFSFGYGPLSLTDLKVGDTPLSQITTEYQVLPGYDDDPDLVYFTNSVDETSLAITLEDGVDVGFRTTSDDAHEGSLDIVFPGGLIAFDEDDGRPGTVEIEFAITYRESGTADPFVGIDATDPLGPGIQHPSAGVVKISGKERGLQTRGVRWLFPAAGQYDVKVVRVSTTVHGVDSDANGTIDEAVWSKLRAIRPGTKPRIRNLCLVEMRILGTDKLGGVVEDFNAMATSVLPVWSDAEPVNDGWGDDDLLSTNGSLEATRNHAWAFCHVLRGQGAQKRVANSKLDMTTIAAWAASIENDGRTFDAVIDFETTVQEVLRDIAGAARAAPTIIDGRYGVAVDEPKPNVVTVFSSRDTHNFRAGRKFRDPIHAMRVQYVNAEAGYQPDELIVYNDGYDESSATAFGRIDLIGQTDPDWAYRDGRYHMASPVLRPTVYSFDIDVAGLSLVQGDRFQFAHDVLLVSAVTGRLTGVTLNAAPSYSGNLLRATLDAEIPYDPEIEWGMVLRLETGETVTAQIWPLLPGSKDIYVLPFLVGVETPVPAQIGDLVVIGELGRETADYLVLSVAPNPELGATVEFIDYSPAIFDVDTEEIPPRDTTITVLQPKPLQVPGRPVIEGIVSDESVLIIQQDGTIEPRIVLTVRNVSGPVATAAWQAQSQIVHDDGTLGEWLTQPPVDSRTPFVSIRGVDAGATYNVRVRATSADGRASDWRTFEGHTVTGASTPPPDVEQFRVERGAVAVWSYPTPPRDFAGFLVRHQAGSSANWATGIPAHDGFLTVAEFDLSPLPVGTRTVMVKAVDLAGNQSVNAGVLVKDIGGSAIANIVESEDFHAAGFPGTKTNGTVEGGSGDLVADDDTSGFWTSAAAPFWTGTGASLFWAQGSLQMTYEDSWAVPGTAVPGRMVLDLGVTAGAWSVEYRINPSTTWLRWPGSLEVAAAATYEFRVITEAGNAESRITAFAAVIDLPDIDEYIEDFTVASTGTVRLPISLTFASIKQTLVTVQDDGNGGIGARILDKDASLGPRIEVYDDTGTRVAGLVDAHVRGY